MTISGVRKVFSFHILFCVNLFYGFSFFFTAYNESTHSGKLCSFNQTHNANDVCNVDINQFGPCSPKNSYGYNNNRPCVFLKLNKIFNWVPEYYDDIKELPDNMPNELKEHIKSVQPFEVREENIYMRFLRFS